MKHLAPILTSLILIFATGCSTSDINIFDDSVEAQYPVAINQMIMPETSGRFGDGRITWSTLSVSQVQLIDDIDNDDFSTDVNMDTEIQALPILEAGLFSRLDVFFNQGIGIKLQVMGDPKLDAEQGFSLAVAYTSLKMDMEEESSDSTGSVKKATADIEVDGEKINVVGGYRTSPRVLYYAGTFYQNVDINNVNLYQTNNTNFTFEDDLDMGSGKAFGVNFGFQYNIEYKILDNFQFTYGVELAYAHIEWERINRTTTLLDEDTEDEIGIGGQVGFLW